jgi:hypothetical protein
MEALTRERGVAGRNLNAGLNGLIESGALPEVFGSMGHITRMLGNAGAHDTETDVTPEDMPIIDEFFRAIVEYLYIAPARVAKVQALVVARQGKKA